MKPPCATHRAGESSRPEISTIPLKLLSRYKCKTGMVLLPPLNLRSVCLFGMRGLQYLLLLCACQKSTRSSHAHSLFP